MRKHFLQIVVAGALVLLASACRPTPQNLDDRLPPLQRPNFQANTQRP